MKIILFDEIQEVDVVDGLYHSLVSLNLEVKRTGRLGQGFKPLGFWQDKISIDNEVDKIINENYNVLFNFRPGSLSLVHLERLKKAGVYLVIWLSDDPVLYNHIYSQIIDSYNLVLHTGDKKILSFYDSKRHRPGVIFPFWANDRIFDYAYEYVEDKYKYLFLGNITGEVKKNRYTFLEELYPDIIAFGKCENDSKNIFSHNISSAEDLLNSFSKAKIAINIPQFFMSYKGTEHFFPEMGDMDHFVLPSRTIQYAAFGLPIVSLGVKGKNLHFPEINNIYEIQDLIRNKKYNDTEFLISTSIATRKRFEKSFTAISRARYLIEMIKNDNIQKFSLHEREFLYAEF